MHPRSPQSRLAARYLPLGSEWRTSQGQNCCDHLINWNYLSGPIEPAPFNSFRICSCELLRSFTAPIKEDGSYTIRQLLRRSRIRSKPIGEDHCIHDFVGDLINRPRRCFFQWFKALMKAPPSLNSWPIGNRRYWRSDITLKKALPTLPQSCDAPNISLPHAFKFASSAGVEQTRAKY